MSRVTCALAVAAAMIRVKVNRCFFI